MDKLEAERLYSSILHRLVTGDVANFERDFSEDYQIEMQGEVFDLDAVKKRTLLFTQVFEVLEHRIEDIIYSSEEMAVRLFIKVKRRDTGVEHQDTVYFFYEFEKNQAVKAFAMVDIPLDFDSFKANG